MFLQLFIVSQLTIPPVSIHMIQLKCKKLTKPPWFRLNKTSGALQKYNKDCVLNTCFKPE